jgi:ArsR family transcriptional regulator
MERLNDAILDYLKVLCDESRLAIIEYLKDGKKTQAEITKHLMKSQSRASQHLKLLVQAKIVEVTQENGKNYYSIRDMRIYKLLRLVLSLVTENPDERARFTQSLDLLDLLF